MEWDASPQASTIERSGKTHSWTTSVAFAALSQPRSGASWLPNSTPPRSVQKTEAGFFVRYYAPQVRSITRNQFP